MDRTTVSILAFYPNDDSCLPSSSVSLAFEMLSPREVCNAFTRALKRQCTYVHSPKIDIRVAIPTGYREQLQGIEVLFGQMQAPYFPPSLFQIPPDMSGSPKGKNKNQIMVLTDEARMLWEGWRGVEEYAREAFLAEEEANGMDWMMDMKSTAS